MNRISNRRHTKHTDSLAMLLKYRKWTVKRKSKVDQSSVWAPGTETFLLAEKKNLRAN